jgi:hypothetical protein
MAGMDARCGTGLLQNCIEPDLRGRRRQEED